MADRLGATRSIGGELIAPRRGEHQGIGTPVSVTSAFGLCRYGGLVTFPVLLALNGGVTVH